MPNEQLKTKRIYDSLFMSDKMNHARKLKLYKIGNIN